MKVQESLVSTKKTTSGRMLGCYILCSESSSRGRSTDGRRSRWIDNKSKVEEVDREKLKSKISMTSQPTRG
jgi:hypothetical protein